MTSIGQLGLNMATAATLVVFIIIVVGAFVLAGFLMGCLEPWGDAVNTKAWPIEGVGIAVGPGRAVSPAPTSIVGPLTRRKLRTLGDLRREQARKEEARR